MPVNPESIVRVQIRAAPLSHREKTTPFPARCWRWSHDGGPGDVMFFEQVGELAK